MKCKTEKKSQNYLEFDINKFVDDKKIKKLLKILLFTLNKWIWRHVKISIFIL